MKRTLALLLVLGMTFTSVIGCGGQEEAAKTKLPEEEETKEAEVKAEENDSELAQTDTLVVYSPAPEAMLTMIIQEFQDRTGVKVELVQAGSGELFTRIESESENPLADVMFGGGAEAAETYKEYLQAYESSELENIAEAYRSSDNTWTGAFVSPTAIMYNKDLVPENEVPTGWADFGEEKWKGKISFADPASSGSSYTTLTILLAAMAEGDGDNGWDFIRSYVDTLDGNILNSSSAPHKGVADGEYAMCITQEQAILNYIVAGAQNVGIVYPEEGTGAIPSTVAIVKGAPNEANAQKFVDFVLSAEVQAKFSEYLYHCVRTDVQEEGEFAPISEIKMADFDFLKAAEDKDANIQKWNDIVIGK